MSKLKTAFVLIGTALLLTSAWSADRWSPEQKEVWAAETRMWDLAKAKNSDAFLAMIHADYVGWNYEYPVPASRMSVDKWIRYMWGSSESTTEIYDLAPLEIVVNGDMAVCFYYYFTMTKNAEGEKKEHEGRWVDVWTRDGGMWMLIADHGGSVEDDDDDD